MALTPESFDNEEIEDEQEDVTVASAEPEPTRTWRLDSTTGRIREVIDDEAAVRQYIRRAIGTARNRYIIYNDQYGSELEELIGANMSEGLINTEIPRLVREAIIYDDRIISVPSIEVERISPSDVLVRATVETIYGDEMAEEVVL